MNADVSSAPQYVRVRPIALRDREVWEHMYRAYAAAYAVTDQSLATVWGWLHDPTHELEGLVAVDEREVVGFAQLRRFARPTTATYGGYLDDLYVVPEARGRGVADALLVSIHELAVARGWTTVRWITSETNYRARAKYDRVAQRSDAVTYDMSSER